MKSSPFFTELLKSCTNDVASSSEVTAGQRSEVSLIA